jgi:O-antigen/teichoic acid export membrane protein
MPLLQHFVGEDYREGLGVIPIVMMAEIFMGVYFNLSFWYKLTDQNWWGAIISAIGVAVMIAVNVIGVPRIGYWACAWGGFAGYGISMILSWAIGRKKYPVPYDYQTILLFVAVAGTLYFAGRGVLTSGLSTFATLAVNTLLLLPYLALCWYKLIRRG